VSWYQKGKTNLDFTEARDSEWQWHHLGHMQVCTSLQTDTVPAPTTQFLQAGCPSCCPTNSIKALNNLLLLVKCSKYEMHITCSNVNWLHAKLLVVAFGFGLRLTFAQYLHNNQLQTYKQLLDFHRTDLCTYLASKEP